MARYLTLYNFTDQGVRAVKDSPVRLKSAIKRGNAAGAKVISAWYTEGPYDLVVITEADDEKTAAAFALSIAAQGNVRSTTMRAWMPEEFEEIVGRMP
ncbi:MAG: GYD domain-containing protein [Gemmatimonadota bacterium]|jgi:uncharacterized protein with GYD domain